MTTQSGRAAMTPAKLKTIRKHLRLTQAGLAKAIGMSTRMISNYEKGRDRAAGKPRPIPRTVALAVRHLLCIRG